MPRLTEENFKASSVQYSGARINDLAENEYTLGVIIVDETGSVSPFANGLLEMLKVCARTCQKNPRKNNMLLRVIAFNTEIREIHGFREVPEINPDIDYDEFYPSGQTALFDAYGNGIESIIHYGENLAARKIKVNGVIFGITDGDDNASSMTAVGIGDKLRDALKSEKMGFISTFLVGVNDQQCKADLDFFKQKAGLLNYISMGNVTEDKLLELSGWMSSSISDASQLLGQGAGNQSVSLKI
jgi:uncharacterized protein YegL